MNKRRIVKQIVESVVNRLLLGEGEDKPKVTIDNAQEMLDKGHKPEDLFGYVGNTSIGYKVVRLKDESNKEWYNVIDEQKSKLVFNEWLRYARVGVDGKCITIQYKNGKFNFINSGRELASKEGFDEVINIPNGFYIVDKDFRYTFVTNEGYFINKNMWAKSLEDIHPFDSSGYAKIKIKDKWFRINKKGEMFNEKGQQTYMPF